MKALLAACFALITLTGCTQTVTFDEMEDLTLAEVLLNAIHD
jgi:hypothetical protein